MTFHHRDSCRLCDSKHLNNVLSITPTPPANAFVSKNELDTAQNCYPLELWFCQACSHVQLLDVVDPAELFSEYVYVSGTSPVFVKHFEDYAAALIDYTSLERNSLVVDLGSNDGTFLKFFKNHGARVVGIDPAVNVARQASENGIDTIPAFFDKTIADRIRRSYGPADIVTANNVFAHIDDLAEVVNCVKFLLENNGIFIFEVSYLLDLYEKKYFDMIYHEHLDYHSLQPLLGFFAKFDMQIIKVERVDTHGGSLRCYVQKTEGVKAVDQSVNEIASLEKNTQLDREQTFIRFGEEITKLGNELRNVIAEFRSCGKQIAGFGAPAKATTLMYHYGVSADDIAFIVDDSPMKQGLYTPGLHIPVLASSAIEKFKPDYLLILAWNFADSIISKNQDFLDRGGHFIIPLPMLKVI